MHLSPFGCKVATSSRAIQTKTLCTSFQLGLSFLAYKEADTSPAQPTAIEKLRVIIYMSYCLSSTYWRQALTVPDIYSFTSDSHSKALTKSKSNSKNRQFAA